MQEVLIEIATNTAQAIGTEFLAALVRSTREAMEAKLVFITVGVGEVGCQLAAGSPARAVRI